MRAARVTVAALTLVLTLVACGQGDSEELTVYAAASLHDAFRELATAYGDATGIGIALSFEASSTLRTQIAEGAPADAFASADLANAQRLVDAGLTEGSVRTFATNALVIVVPAANPAGLTSWKDLARPGIRVVAAGEAVPISRYADELLDRLGSLPDAPAEFVRGYAANVVSREDNVRAALAKVEIGEADAAIVYQTDAHDSSDVATLAVPEEANVAAEYGVVVVKGADPSADGFVGWLLDAEAQRILGSHGFGRP